MKSKVYFIPVGNADSLAVVQKKLRRLLEKSKVLDVIPTAARVVMKTHFGEQGNTGYVKPEYIRVVAEGVLARQATPVVSDTNTLYKGQRTNSRDHLELARQHGFTKENTLAGVIIPEDSKETVAIVPVNQKFIKQAKVSRLFIDAGALIDVAHFKGHLMTGFGGALKNIGMGCASREGKLAQHSDLSPIVHETSCVGCGACVKICPVNAISLKSEGHGQESAGEWPSLVKIVRAIPGILSRTFCQYFGGGQIPSRGGKEAGSPRVSKKAIVDGDKCIGCASCLAACNYHAMDVKWESGGSTIQEKMVEYAKAVLDRQQGRTVFLNFALKITKECDCLAQDDPRISPDIGIFAAHDPVAIDKACYDQILKACGKDVIKESHPDREGMRQLTYAAELGLGNLEYELIQIPFD